MTAQTQSLLDAALTLPESERALLVDRLLRTLPPPDEEVSDDELEAELEKRFEEYRRDPGSAISWSEVKRRK